MRKTTWSPGEIEEKRLISGQVLTEYAMVLALCAFVGLTLLVFFGIFGSYGRNLLVLIGIDAP